MQAKPDHRDRPAEEVAVLDALAARAEDGMTVFELRAAVDVSIDDLEDALAALDDDDLIVVEEGERTVIRPRDRAIAAADTGEQSALDRFRDWLFG